MIIPASVFVLAVPFTELAQKAAFLALSAGSLWLFYKTLDQRLLSQFSKPWKFPPGPVGKRLRRTFVEVVLQSRVIRDRPITGIFHALVVWGFIAFAWISMKHLSLGIRGLDQADDAPGFYGAFAAGWAIAVLLGIVALSFRRFVLRPKSLGKLSPTSALVAA